MKIGPKGRMHRVVSTVERMRGSATGPTAFTTTTCSTTAVSRSHAWRAVKTYCTAKKAKTSTDSHSRALPCSCGWGPHPAKDVAALGGPCQVQVQPHVLMEQARPQAKLERLRQLSN